MSTTLEPVAQGEAGSTAGAPDGRTTHWPAVWAGIRREASSLSVKEPLLHRRLESLVLTHRTPAEVLAAVLARRLSCTDMPEAELRPLMLSVLHGTPAILKQTTADLAAVLARDPACPSLLHVLLNLKGFHALQTYRIAHALWQQGRPEMALTLSNLAAMVLGLDIHPASRIGQGVMLDHGNGIVIGETAVVEDDVSILQDVTLGGTGKEHGDRHPKIRSGVMIGAGAKILGNIEVGARSKVAAGSVVLHPVPADCTVAGVPARVRRRHEDRFPAGEMNQMI